jgi:hypothetical protein
MAGTKACGEGSCPIGASLARSTRTPPAQPPTSLLRTLGAIQPAEFRVVHVTKRVTAVVQVSAHRAAILARQSASPNATAVRQSR